jgi:hypothetical protein
VAKENNCRFCDQPREERHKKDCASGKGGQLIAVEETNGFQWVKGRPEGYETLSAREQWAIDKRLGILDWEP